MNCFKEQTDFIFTTKVYQKIWVEDKNQGQVLEEATEMMNVYEELLSFFREESEVSLVNKNAGKGFVSVSKDTFKIIQKSKKYSDLTQGLFDITIAPLVKIWNVKASAPQIPSEQQRKESLSLVNYEDILLNEGNASVMLARESQQIDLGGIAKGYIADQIVELYKRHHIRSAVINLGGNVKVLGSRKKGNLWEVGITEPKKHSQQTVGALQLNDLSVVTSGGYERAFRFDGVLYHHILNRRTGCPAETDLKSMTVVSEESIEADALATPLFIMGKYKAADFMKQNHISGMMIAQENEIIMSRDLLPRFSLTSPYKVLTF